MIAVAAFGLSTLHENLPASAQTASSIDCREFVDQAEAQRFFEAKGGPRADPFYLDGDGDGIACEPGPPPIPVSQRHAENCEAFFDHLDEVSVSADVLERTRQECMDWIVQTGGYPRCAAYEGLSFRYFSRLNQSQVAALPEMQKAEYDYLMNLPEGECVAVDVAKTSAWGCYSFPFYVAEYQRRMNIPINTYYQDRLNERYQVVCMGAPLDVGGRKYPLAYLIGAGLIGAGIVYLYSRHQKSQEAQPHRAGSASRSQIPETNVGCPQGTTIDPQAGVCRRSRS